MKRNRLRISVYDYLDYQKFLKDSYEDLHAQDADFSHRVLQRKAGYSESSNHFWQVATGYAKLGQQAAQRYARAFGLDAKETQYFSLMAAMNQARTDVDRNAYLEQLKQAGGRKMQRNGKLLRYEFYSDWMLPALRELVGLSDFREDPGWMALKLAPKITPRQARNGIDKLLDLGYLQRDETGALKPCEPFIGDWEDRTDDDPLATLAIRNYHRRMIQLGSDALENHTQDKRLIIGTTMAVSRSQAGKIMEFLREEMKQVERIVLEDEPVETVCRLNIQYFPLTDDHKNNGK